MPGNKPLIILIEEVDTVFCTQCLQPIDRLHTRTNQVYCSYCYLFD